MNQRTTDESKELIQPITSPISKSEKAQAKLTRGTWQHTMLSENLRALHVALALMSERKDRADEPTRKDLQDALGTFAEMMAKSEKVQGKFPPGTSQHTLQRNRLRAFRAAEALIRNRLK